MKAAHAARTATALASVATVLAGCSNGTTAMHARGAADTLRDAEARPARPGVTTPVRVTFPTPYAIGDATRNGHHPRGRPRSAQGADNYHVVLTGPGGPACRDRLNYALGYATERRRAVRRTIVIEPARQGLGGSRRGRIKAWCPGRYAGRIEYRQPDRTPAIPFERVGTFSFEVARGG